MKGSEFIVYYQCPIGFQMRQYDIDNPTVQLMLDEQLAILNEIIEIEPYVKDNYMVSKLEGFRETTIMNQYLQANKALLELNTMKEHLSMLCESNEFLNNISKDILKVSPFAENVFQARYFTIKLSKCGYIAPEIERQLNEVKAIKDKLAAQLGPDAF